MREGTYYHAMLDRNLPVKIVSGPDKRGRYRVRLPYETPFNGAVRTVLAMWVSES